MLRETSDAIVADFGLTELAHIFDSAPHPCRTKETADREAAPHTDAAWYGGIRTLDDARRILDGGWDDGARRLEQLAREIQVPAARARRRVLRWTDNGDELSVDRAMRGQFDTAWRSSRRTWSAGPQAITLLTMWGGNAYTSAEELFWQGAACAVLTDLLESAGYRVRVVAGTPMTNRYGSENRLGGILVTVKEEHEPMRVDALAGVVCHAGIFRTHGFRAILATTHTLNSSAQREWTEDSIAKVRETGAWPDNVVTLGNAHNRAAALAQITATISNIEGVSNGNV